MRRNDFIFCGVMAIFAAFIWLRDLGWTSTLDDTLPILVAIPLFFWLEWPWKFSDRSFQLKPAVAVAVVGLFLGGILGNLTLLLTLSWCLALWHWIDHRVVEELRPRLLKLMVLPFMAFPWVTLDAYAVGWWFRLSGAWATSVVFAGLGFDVSQEGTQLLVNQVPISVDVSCAGLNTLQSMLIAGSVLAYIQLGHLKRYWINIPFLAVVAWLANTLRICMLTAVAVLVSPEFAMGPFHESGGWVVLFVMFCLCWAVFALQGGDEPAASAEA